MINIDAAGIFSSVFDEDALHFPLSSPSSTDSDGRRIPSQWGEAVEISVSLQDITADELERLQPGEHTSGSMYAFTSADLALGDRIQVSRDMWEVRQVLTTARHIAPGRNQYLVTRV